MKRVKLLFISVLVGLSMTACGGKQDAVEKSVEASGVSVMEPKEQEGAAAKEGASEVVVEAKQEVASEASVEVKEEATPETVEVPESVVYEGIDMESELPWKEWVDTFDDIITEPKYVVVNDETNKKVIVESGQSVEIEEGDVFGIYFPEGYVATTIESENGYVQHSMLLKKGPGHFGKLMVYEGEVTTDTLITQLFYQDEEYGKISCTIICENLDWIRKD